MRTKRLEHTKNNKSRTGATWAAFPDTRSRFVYSGESAFVLDSENPVTENLTPGFLVSAQVHPIILGALEEDAGLPFCLIFIIVACLIISYTFKVSETTFLQQQGLFIFVSGLQWL